MEYARESVEKLADKMNLSKSIQSTALDILNEFLGKNNEWRDDNI